MATEDVSQELWHLAVENVEQQQEGDFDALFTQAAKEHVAGECRNCEDGLCAGCEEWIATGIENWQESQFDDQVEAEYDRLVEQREETE